MAGFCVRIFTKRILLLTILVIPFLASSQYISEKGFITINGLEQWITLKGDRSKPVILFLHGGPGSPLSSYADAIFSGWDSSFLLAQWDQRGAGKTYGRVAPDELNPAFLKEKPLTVDAMTRDGIGVAEYLLRHLGKQKILLFGTSWGSVLGVQMAHQRPDLFCAYVGHAQVVHPSDSLKRAYEVVYKLAMANSDHASMKVLQSLGRPPYDTARHSGQLFRIIKKYERHHSSPDPENWLQVAAEYDHEMDKQHRADGDDYSFVNYVGDVRLGVSRMHQPPSPFVFQMPVYLIQGTEDILTPKEVSKKYFDAIRSPSKKFILVPGAAHGFHPAVIETMLSIFKELKAKSCD